ncbi:MAG: type II toxin-antitoxin system YafQ family toxin [bacterium]|nr:type II toxin-antitoxin system YafQ family toxin [bacterium]
MYCICGHSSLRTSAGSSGRKSLTGEWLGFWECHIGPNWLLIYDVTDTEVLLARTGSHVDLFE